MQLWIELGNPIYPGIVVAFMIDIHTNGYFHIHRRKKDMQSMEYNEFCDEYIQKTFKKWISETPLHTYLNMWHSFTQSLGRSHFRLIDDPGSVNIRRWTRENSINHRQFSEMISIISQKYRIIRKDFRRVNVNVSLFEISKIMKDAVPLLQNIYSDNALNQGWSGDMYHTITGIKHVFDNRCIISTIERNNHGKIIPLATHEIITCTGRPMGYIDLCIPFPITKEINEDSI